MGVWQLPIKQSNVRDYDWVHFNAKYHYFEENQSLCEKYFQNTDFLKQKLRAEKSR